MVKEMGPIGYQIKSVKKIKQNPDREESTFVSLIQAPIPTTAENGEELKLGTSMTLSLSLSLSLSPAIYKKVIRPFWYPKKIIQFNCNKKGFLSDNNVLLTQHFNILMTFFMQISNIICFELVYISV